MALTQNETSFLHQLKSEGKSEGELVSALKQKREGGFVKGVKEFGLGYGKASTNIISQLSRLAPGDQSADPNSFYSQTQKWMPGAEIERQREGQNVDSFANKAGVFAGEIAPTIPLSMGAGMALKGLVGLGLKVAPSIASKAVPFVNATKGIANATKFGAFEGAKDSAIYGLMNNGETSVSQVALGAAGGGVLGLAGGAAGSAISRLKNAKFPVAGATASKAGSYTEGAFGSGIKTAKGMVNDALSPFKSNIDELHGMMTALKPKQIVRNGAVTRGQEQITREVTQANNLLKANGIKPKNLGEYNGALKGQMQKIGSQIEAKTKQKLSVNMSSTAQKLDDLANSPALTRIDPQGAEELKRIAERMRLQKGVLKVEDAEFMNQFINDELKNVASASETRKKGLQIVVGDLRDKLDEAISKIPGEFKDLKKTYGALRNVYRDGISREIVYNRANPEGLISSYSKIEGASDMMSGMMKILGLDVKGGVIDIGKGLTKNKMGQLIKTKNDPNYIINKIFNDSNIPNSVIPDTIPRSSSNSLNTTLSNKVAPKVNIKKVSQTYTDPKPVIVPKKQTLPKKVVSKPKPTLPLSQKTPTIYAKIPTKLETSAKKYKSAEDFVKAQKPLYHGTNAKFEEFDLTKSGDVQPEDWGVGAYFTDNPTHAKDFAKVAGGDIVMERFTPNVKFADGSKLIKDSKFQDVMDDGMGFSSPAEYLQEKGFDGVKFKNPQGFTEYVVYDTSKIKTKSQLTNIWNKANK